MKRVDEQYTRREQTVIRFRLVDEEAEALKKMLGEQSIQDHFEKYVRTLLVSGQQNQEAL